MGADHDGNLYANAFTEAQMFRADVKDGHASAVTHLVAGNFVVFADGSDGPVKGP
ncbi:hypothetical protein [Methylobacterium sp. Leaf86]|uniref:hypothetical protein n=1 Tax=Methylobacterium sp. Leaf86 TaxID=1736242 RepID=UPI000A96A102|nr:hypothetical protein [Methylobacterium sp. Leaf86]